MSLALFSEIFVLLKPIASCLRALTVNVFELYLFIIACLFSLVRPKLVRKPTNSFFSVSFFSAPLFLERLSALFLFKFLELIRFFLSWLVRFESVLRYKMYSWRAWFLLSAFLVFLKFLASWINLLTSRLPLLYFFMSVFWSIWLRPRFVRRDSSFFLPASMLPFFLDSWSFKAWFLMAFTFAPLFFNNLINSSLFDWLISSGSKNEKRFCWITFFFSSILSWTNLFARPFMEFRFVVSFISPIRAFLSESFNL